MLFKSIFLSFIDFSNDGYTRTNRKKASKNLFDTDRAKERYQEVVDLVRVGKSKLNIFTEKEYYDFEFTGSVVISGKYIVEIIKKLHIEEPLMKQKVTSFGNTKVDQPVMGSVSRYYFGKLNLIENIVPITDVPGLKSGCNYETYKAYIDFAAANNIAYVILDEGWAEKLNLDKPRDEVNVPGVVEYGKSKGVGIILWAAWPSLIDPHARQRIFDRYAAMGVKGFKVDFIERDDQMAERFLEETASDAAKRRLVILYHGIHKPTGLQRTYPNILNYEGVYGLEQGGDKGGKKEVVANDVNLIYSRMIAGFMDYTPGAMRNRAFDAPEFDKTKEPFAAYGTRCHQLALFPQELLLEIPQHDAVPDLFGCGRGADVGIQNHGMVPVEAAEAVGAVGIDAHFVEHIGADLHFPGVTT